jgi:hypothetical protein
VLIAPTETQMDAKSELAPRPGTSVAETKSAKPS